MTVKDKLIQVSEEILKELLAFKQLHPNFTCSLRSRDSVQSDEIRLGNGQWFQGSDYIFVPLFKKGDYARKIKTIGFVLIFNEDASIKSNYLEISFKSGSEKENEQAFHKDLANKLNIELNNQNFGTIAYDNPNNYLQNLSDYLNRVRPIALELLEHYGLSQKYIVPEKEFQKRIKNINEIKKSLGISTDIIYKQPMEHIIKLLKHKKQIILQGPPGTGKTFTAKKIAEQITGVSRIDSYNSLTPEKIKSALKVGQKIANASGKEAFYTVKKINENEIVLQSEKSQPWKANYSRTIEKFIQLTEGIEPKNTNNLDPYELAVAKYMFDKIKPTTSKTENNYKLVQFHPSYNYEDFVRGITVKNENGAIVYITENKIFGDIIEKASRIIEKDETPLWELFRNHLYELEKKLNEDFFFDKQNKIRFLDVYYPDEDKSKLRYEVPALQFDGWTMPTWIDIKENFNERTLEIGLNINHPDYNKNWISIFNYFKAFAKSQLESKNNYVLIIDEINRANLPSVLGELIYALEYRGEAVDSLYAIDGDAKITIPENLYIIGTMNTADRSVGHIDYAIKRRFAFVDMLPNVEVITNDKAKELFNKVSELFTEKYLASDFDAKDVHLGHSYFLLDENSDLTESEQLKLKLDYEILPILNEYVKDGLLLETAKDKLKEIAKFEC